jgi:hypothetical protein
MGDPFTREALETSGFEGFTPVSQLAAGGLDVVPLGPGVYVVLRISVAEPTFLRRSRGGWFKGNDPTVPVSLLEDRWLPAVQTVYIGKATAGTSGSSGLRKRIGQLVSYGRGRPVGHQGGRYLWQLDDSDALVVAWRPERDPTAAENHLLASFLDAFGRLPFANIAGPPGVRSW